MSSLVPERRTDRAGRTQTRWVKAARPPATASGIPSAAVPSSAAASHGTVLAEIREAIDWPATSASEAVQGDPALAAEVLAIVRDADGDERVLGALNDALRSLDGSNPHLGLKLRFVLVESLWGQRLRPNPLGNPYRHAENRESALFYVAEARGDEPETRESAELALALGFMCAACRIHGINQGVRTPSTTAYYLYDHPALVGVFDEYRDRAREVAEFVIDHGPDAAAARAFMRGEDCTVLTEGIL